MRENCLEQVIDLRKMAPRFCHPAIFNTWNELPDGAAIRLLNDDDPVPLYYQFAAEYAGRFHWEYLEAGPQVWQVLISKGGFDDPGFQPGPPEPAAGQPSDAISLVKPCVLDTRPIFGRGETPCDAIDDAVARLLPKQSLIVLVPFEPVPLYAKLGNQGFCHESMALEDGTWRVEFRKQ